jgi:hypothetical protein
MSLSNSEHNRRNESSAVKPILWATISFGLLWAYILCVGFLDEMIVGINVSIIHIMIATLGGFVFLSVLFTWATNQSVLSNTAIRDASLGASTVVVGLVLLDLGYSIFLNSSQSRSAPGDRYSDVNSWIGELYPGMYFPTEKNFRLHKPGRTITASHYGDMYHPTLLASPLLSSSVFSKKHVTISINEEGFRETTNLDGHKVLALGDSFTFGWGVDQGRTWVELLERSIGEPIFNMGMQDSSPKQEFLLLEHVIDSQKLDFRGGVLLWMIFEGNDLIDSYDDLHPVQKSVSTSGGLFRDTILETLRDLPAMVRQESVFARFKDGRATFSDRGEENRTKAHYVIDGIPSPYPLYVSPQFGAKLFASYQIKGAQRSEQYVDSHPNRLALETTFERMKSLAHRAGFRVVVIIAPSGPRLHGAEFEDFPTLSERSYFNILISRLAGQYGFEIVNLEESLRPYATKELLHFRDDDHWNERGHMAVADILSGFLRSRNAALVIEK